MSDELALFLVAAPGLERAVLDEARALVGARAVREVQGGVELAGDAALLVRANLRLAIASRVLVRLGRVRAREFAELRAGVAALPWARVARRGATLDVRASVQRCRLYHTGGIAERVQGGVADALGGPATEGRAPLAVLVRGDGDQFTISVDASGELLHRRGYRVDTAKASLRETLAAGLLALAGWQPGEALCDPMCGAGTIALEAARRAAGLVPGAGRDFACEAWPMVSAAVRAAVRGEPGPAAIPTPILAADRDAQAIDWTRRNAERAGVAAQLTVVHGDAASLTLPAERGLILANPPYGRRLDAGHHLDAYRALADLRRRHPGWRVAAICPDARAAAALGARPLARHRVDNGGVRVDLAVWA